MSQAELQYNRKIINDYHDCNGDFMENMKLKINEMFDENIPFTQTTNESHCKYCKFKDFCRR